MSTTLLAQIGLVAVAVGALLVLVAAVRFRRHRERLARIGSRHSLGLATGPCPAGLLEKAGRYQGRDRRVGLRDVMVGRGDSANTFLARRRIGLRSHMLLCFELGRSAHLEGFFVVPEASRRADRSQLCLRWRAPREQWNDEVALSMAARVMYNLSVVGERPDAIPLGLEIRGARVWIHSQRALRGQALEHFVSDAMRLRSLLLKSLERASDAGRRSGRTRSVTDSTLRQLVRA